MTVTSDYTAAHRVFVRFSERYSMRSPLAVRLAVAIEESGRPSAVGTIRVLAEELGVHDSAARRAAQVLADHNFACRDYGTVGLTVAGVDLARFVLSEIG